MRIAHFCIYLIHHLNHFYLDYESCTYATTRSFLNTFVIQEGRLSFRIFPQFDNLAHLFLLCMLIHE